MSLKNHIRYLGLSMGIMFNQRLNTILEDEFGDLDDKDTFGRPGSTIIYFFMPNELIGFKYASARDIIRNHIVNSIINDIQEWTEKAGELPDDDLLASYHDVIMISGDSAIIDKYMFNKVFSKFDGGPWAIYQINLAVSIMLVDEFANQIFVKNIEHNGKSYRIPWFIDGDSEYSYNAHVR